MRQYKVISKYYYTIFIDHNGPKIYDKQKKQLKAYFDNLLKYLEHSLVINYYKIDMEIDVSVVCKISEYEDIKKRCLEFEQLNNMEGILSITEDYSNQLILRKTK